MRSRERFVYTLPANHATLRNEFDMARIDSNESLMRNYPHIDHRRQDFQLLFEDLETPVFVCERSILNDRFGTLLASLDRHWGPSHIAYSFKTNYLIAQSGVIQQLQGWAEVVSAHEYRMARELGYAGPSIVFNGPHKPEDVLRQAIEDGALLHVNDHDELDAIVRLTRAAKKPLPLGIRISTDLPKGGLSRFGFSIEDGEAESAVSIIENSESLELVSVHAHLYGDTDDPQHYRDAAVRVGEFLTTFVPDYQARLQFIDMGGGFPAHSPKPKSRTAWNPLPIDSYVEQIVTGLQTYFPDRKSRPILIVEPGRYLTCDATILVTRVLHVKDRSGRQIVNCDGSISMVPLTHYCPQLLQAFTPDWHPRDSAMVESIIHGSTCRENDILWDGAFPRLQRGDYLVHYAAGAYNSSLCPDFIFPCPGLVWV